MGMYRRIAEFFRPSLRNSREMREHMAAREMVAAHDERARFCTCQSCQQAEYGGGAPTVSASADCEHGEGSTPQAVLFGCSCPSCVRMRETLKGAPDAQ